MRLWPLILSDFRREYRIDSDELAELSLSEFLWLLQGLSEKSPTRRAFADAPRETYTPEDIAAVHAAARR